MPYSLTNGPVVRIAFASAISTLGEAADNARHPVLFRTVPAQLYGIRRLHIGAVCLDHPLTRDFSFPFDFTPPPH